MSDTRDRTFCRKHCKGFRDTGGRCFADGECEKYTEYMKNERRKTKKNYYAVTWSSSSKNNTRSPS